MSQGIVCHAAEEIAQQCDGFIRRASSSLSEEELPVLKRALHIALEDAQGRCSDEARRPLGVATIVAEKLQLSLPSLLCALLYRAVAVGSTPLPEVRRYFGDQVAQLIEELLMLEQLPKQVGHSYIEHFKSFASALTQDGRSVLVKLAICLYEMHIIDTLPEHVQQSVAHQVQHVYVPLAHQLGLYAMKTELEDLHFKFMQPVPYHDLKARVDAQNQKYEQLFLQFQHSIRNQLEAMGWTYTLKSRVKGIFSTWKKMERQSVPFEEVYDLFAIRIILQGVPPEQEKQACWEIYLFITDLYKPRADRTRNWIGMPRVSGYESLHVTVQNRLEQWVEVQVRTQRMDEVAEHGYAAHWQYKDRKSAKMTEQELSWLRGVRGLVIQEVTQSTDSRATDQIMVLLPNDTVQHLPVGSTVLDLAFALDEAAAGHCAGAYVNDKPVPLSHALHNSDYVVLHTDKGTQHVSAAWRQWATTQQAKEGVEKLLKAYKTAATASGKAILQRRLKDLRLVLNKKLATQLCTFFDTTSIKDLCQQLGEGSVDPQELHKFTQAGQQQRRTGSDVVSWQAFEEFVVTHQQREREQLLLLRHKTVLTTYTLSKCCQPTPDDAIISFADAQGTTEVHRKDCAQIAERLPAAVDVRWAQPYPVDVHIRLEATPRPQLQDDILHAVTREQSVDLASSYFSTRQQLAHYVIKLTVRRADALRRILQQLGRVQGISRIAPPSTSPTAD